MDQEQIQVPDQAGDFDVDAYMAQADAPGAEIPMDAPAEQAAPAEQQAQPETQAQQNHILEWNGKQIEATLDQLKKWGQQGYDYSQKIAEFNRQKQEFESKYQPYQTIDQFARENPEWWSHVQQAWEQRQNAATNQQGNLDPNNPLTQELLAVKQELAELKGFKQELTQKELNQKREAEDQKLNQQIQSMREQYKHLDWNKVDENGHDLEMQVIAYANKNNIGSFDAAFKAYNHDRFMSLAMEKGKELASQEIKKNTKLGLLGKSPTPTKEVTGYQKGKSYDQLLQESLQELGFA